MSAVFDKLARALGPLAQTNVSLAPFTTYRIGGPASLMARVASVEDLCRVAGLVDPTEVPILVIGQGSNLLVADRGWNGLVVTMGGPEFEAITVDGLTVRAGAAVKLPVLARSAVAHDLGGLEWMVGVPGSVGGAIRMNAGGHGSDVSANVCSVGVIDVAGHGELIRRSSDSFGFSYRHSNVSATEVVVDAEFLCTPINREPDSDSSGEDALREIVRWRRANQPGGANCGSVFTNPPDDSAGRLIDAAGLKGHRIGSAFVSDKHANFIQADPEALAADVWALIKHVRRVVFERFGVVLTPEVRTAGFDASLDPLS